eukprot:5817014-Amphidinium_carterae.1
MVGTPPIMGSPGNRANPTVRTLHTEELLMQEGPGPPGANTNAEQSYVEDDADADDDDDDDDDEERPMGIGGRIDCDEVTSGPLERRQTLTRKSSRPFPQTMRCTSQSTP